MSGRAVKEKRARTAKQKLATLRGHIKTLRLGSGQLAAMFAILPASARRDTPWAF